MFAFMNHRRPKCGLPLILSIACCMMVVVPAWVIVPRTVSHHDYRSTNSMPMARSIRKESENEDYAMTTPTHHKQQQRDSPWIPSTLIGCCLLFFSTTLPLPTIAATPSYWEAQTTGTPTERFQANSALVDCAMGTIRTMYYDASGGSRFQPLDFYRNWMRSSKDEGVLFTREGTVERLKELVQSVGDPYSKYLTRQELRAELEDANDGFLGSGAMVEPATEAQHVLGPQPEPSRQQQHWTKKWTSTGRRSTSSPLYLTSDQVDRLPVITAVSPNSPAERAGLTVGDRIVSVGSDSFLEKDQKAIRKRLGNKYHAENYFGRAFFTVAKPVRASIAIETNDANNNSSPWKQTAKESPRVPEVIIGYRSTKVQLPTLAASSIQRENGNSIVQYQMLKGSIFDESNTLKGDVGYIRLTRFSKAATNGFIQAVEDLENQGASAYIVDLRNNYGGVIQEAMLTASALLRDPHAILCYTMNSRGGFTPHDVNEYVLNNERYPGYLLSTESKQATLLQAQYDRDAAERNTSIHQLRQRSRPAPRSNLVSSAPSSSSSKNNDMVLLQQLASQKDIVLLVNEGTASSAEVFTAALHDNGRLVALVGSTQTYGKGLVQHTFPLPDGGGLRLTVAEYLRPNLQHVSRVGGAQFDAATGQWVGGGIAPDIKCGDSTQGIPNNIGADLCVGMALDALEEAELSFQASGQLAVQRRGGVDDGSKIRRAVTMGVVRADF